MKFSSHRKYDLWIINEIFKCKGAQFGVAAFDADVDYMRDIGISESEYFDYCEDVCGRGRCDNIKQKDFRDEKACDRYGFNGLLFSSSVVVSLLANSDGNKSL